MPIIITFVYEHVQAFGGRPSMYISTRQNDITIDIYYLTYQSKANLLREISLSRLALSW